MRTAFLVFILIPLFGLTQGMKFYPLQNLGKPNYTESNQFFGGSIWRFHQTVTYNEANTFDEEHWTRLEIQIKDTAGFLRRKILDFTIDSLKVNHYFTEANVWSSNQDSTSITGQVQLLSITSKGISIKLNLVVTNFKTQKQFVYMGERTFYKLDKSPSVKDLMDRMPSVNYGSIK